MGQCYLHAYLIIRMDPDACAVSIHFFDVCLNVHGRLLSSFHCVDGIIFPFAGENYTSVFGCSKFCNNSREYSWRKLSMNMKKIPKFTESSTIFCGLSCHWHLCTPILLHNFVIDCRITKYGVLGELYRIYIYKNIKEYSKRIFFKYCIFWSLFQL